MSVFLEGLTVVELGEGFAVPHAGKLLRQMGARVVKIETPIRGDRTRRAGPFPGDRPDPAASGAFIQFNAGKESVTLDVTGVTGRWLFEELLERADVLIHDRPPAQAEALGLSPAGVAARFPRLIVAAITGFGQEGPKASWRANDLVASHAAGIGHRFVGDPGRRPLRPAGNYGDILGALVGVQAVHVALRARARDGIGQCIDVSTQETLASMILSYGVVSNYHQGGDPGTRSSSLNRTLRTSAPAGRFPCQDGWVQLSALADNQWQGLVDVLGNPDWASLFDASPSSRLQYIDLITSQVEEWTRARTVKDVQALLSARGVPCAIVQAAREVLADEHLRARDAFVSVRAGGREWSAPGPPWRAASDPAGVDVEAPRLSAHTHAVLRELGIADSEAEDLRRAGVV